jgi:hypothetical protein
MVNVRSDSMLFEWQKGVDLCGVVTSVRLSGSVMPELHMLKRPCCPLNLIFIIALLGVNVIGPSGLFVICRSQNV